MTRNLPLAAALLIFVAPSAKPGARPCGFMSSSPTCHNDDAPEQEEQQRRPEEDQYRWSPPTCRPPPDHDPIVLPVLVVGC